MTKHEKEIVRSLKQMKSCINPDPNWERKSQDMLLDYFNNTFAKDTNVNFNIYMYLIRPVAVSLLVLVFMFTSGAGLVYASKNSLPGDFLYSVKLTKEKVRIAMAFGKSQKQALRAEVLTKRLDEVKVLARKVELGEKEYEIKLNALAKNFTNDLKVLKKDIFAQIPKQVEIIPFTEKELLDINQDDIFIQDKQTLPIKDGKRIFSVLNSDELKKILSETKDLLNEENLETALVRISQAEEIIKKDEEEQDKEQALEQKQEIKIQEKDKNINIKEFKKSVIIDQPGSIGNVLQDIREKQDNDFQIDIQREVPVKTGLIKE